MAIGNRCYTNKILTKAPGLRGLRDFMSVRGALRAAQAR